MAASASQEPLLFIPSSLPSLPDLLTAWGYSERQIADHQDKVAYVLHQIHTLPLYMKSDSGYSNLNAVALRSMLGKRYADRIVNELLSADIIECDMIYSPGSKSYGYRVTEQYHSKTVGLLILNNSFATKLQCRRQDEQKQLHANTLELKMWQDLQQLRVHYAAACAHNDRIQHETNAFLQEYRQQLQGTTLHLATYRDLLQRATATNPHIRLKSIKEMRKALKSQNNALKGTSATQFVILMRSNIDRYNSNQRALDAIHNQQIPVPTRPIAASRIYTILTNLSATLRQFLYRARQEDQLLWNIDIKNSQPFLLNLLIAQRYAGAELPTDCQLYRELTSTGTFYSYLAKALDAPYTTKLQQKEFKGTAFASLFFARNLHTENSRAGKYFQEHFPNVTKVIHDHKVERYQNLAILMQEVEAGVMLDQVVAALHRKRIWCASVHDSIICLDEHRHLVKQFILDAFTSKYQLQPTVDAEPLCQLCCYKKL